MFEPGVLPVRAVPQTGESLRSLVRRSALAMGYDSIQQLLALDGCIGSQAQLDHLDRGPPLVQLARRLGRIASELETLTAHRFAKQLVLTGAGAAGGSACDSKTLLRFFCPARPRVCSECLRDDPQFEPLLWSFRPLSVCLRHRALLIDQCPQCGRHLRPLRLELVRCACDHDFREAASVQFGDSAHQLSRQLIGWLEGDRVPFEEFSVPAMFWWLDRLAAAMRQTPPWLSRTRAELSLPDLVTIDQVGWLAATEILSQWPARFWEFLDSYQQIDKYHATSTGIGRSFGQFLRAADYLERLGHPAPAEVLREYLLTRYTRGHLTAKTRLFGTAQSQRRLATRPWLTQTEAARHLHLRQGTIRDLVKRRLLVGHTSPAGSKGRTVGVLERSAVDALALRLNRSLSTLEAAKRLGIDRHRVIDLIHDGHLPDAVRTAPGWRIPEQTIAELLDLCGRLPVLPVNHRGWISSRQATRRFGFRGLTLVRLLRLVQQADVAARIDPANRNLRGLYVCEAELIDRLPELQEHHLANVGYTLNQLTHRLFPATPIKAVVLHKWIRAGLLQAEGRGRAWWIAPAEVARFRATYCLAKQAQARLGVSRSTLARWERMGRITAVYSRSSHPGAGATLYWLAEILGHAKPAA